MDAEHDPEFDAPPADPSALGYFFPELTAEEARTLDHETLAIAERRVRVMAEYRTGKGMRAVAATVGCSLGTVHADVHAVLEGYKRLAARAVEEHRADCLQRLAHREAEIEADLERSRGEFVESSTSRRGTASGPQGQAAVRRRQKYGDPRLHALLQGYWDRRCKLLGPLKEGDLKSPTPVKLVAGVDPSDLV